MSIWCLQIENTHGNVSKVLGTEEMLREEVDAWIEYVKNEEFCTLDPEKLSLPARSESEIRTVHGFTDTADRADLMFVFLHEDVTSMTLYRAY